MKPEFLNSTLLALILCFQSLPSHAVDPVWEKRRPGENFAFDQVLVETPQWVKLGQIRNLAKSLGCTLVKKLGTLNYYQFKIPANQTPLSMAAAFEAHPGLVKMAEPNGIMHLHYSPYAYPNDPLYQDGVNE